MGGRGIAVNAGRMLADLDALDRIGRTEAGLFRVAWSPAYREGLVWLHGRFTEAGLATTEDAATNLWGRWNIGNGPALLLGSHIDAVPNGGKFDGAFGVLSALEVLRTLREANITPPFPLAAVAWADEEGAHFGTGFFGSMAFVGTPIADDYVTIAGPGARDTLTASGVKLDQLDSVAAQRSEIGAYLEMHIEQGPRLEVAGGQLAVVTGICGIERHEWQIAGHPSHAGSTPFPMRRDAGMAMARAMAAQRDVAREAGPEVVATVGRLRVTPDVPNIVPGTATFSAEFRDISPEILQAAQSAFARRVQAICAEEHVTASSRPLLITPPTPMHPAMMETIAAACGDIGVTPMRFPSGPGHDAGILARHLPTGMLFVPSINGISHAPDEFTDAASLERGANALLHAVLRLIEQGLPAA
ncbi:MAG: hydantoinase/carbamoylase family amidase [Thermomicrobiales bacterium]